jgi:hypothetical protein
MLEEKLSLEGCPSELLAEAQAKGISLPSIAKLWQAVLMYGPSAAELIRQLVTFFTDPTAPDQPPRSVGDHCDHKALCEQTLRSALCAACCAAEHHRLCCREEHAGG